MRLKTINDTEKYTAGYSILSRAREYLVYKDVPRKKRAFFLIPVCRSKGNLLRYTYMFSFTFVPLVFHPLCPVQRKYKGKSPLLGEFISIILWKSETFKETVIDE